MECQAADQADCMIEVIDKATAKDTVCIVFSVQMQN